MGQRDDEMGPDHSWAPRHDWPGCRHGSASPDGRRAEHYTIPVSYQREGDIVTVTTKRQRKWWHSVRDTTWKVELRPQPVDAYAGKAEERSSDEETLSSSTNHPRKPQPIDLQPACGLVKDPELLPSVSSPDPDDTYLIALAETDRDRPGVRVRPGPLVASDPLPVFDAERRFSPSFSFTVWILSIDPGIEEGGTRRARPTTQRWTPQSSTTTAPAGSTPNTRCCLEDDHRVEVCR